MPACARCGRANPDEANFCSRCGAPIPGDAPAPAAARKIVTVVFADVTGFTALGERLDAESLQQLVGRWFTEAQRVIDRHGGTVEKFIGDAVMAVFGVPVVHEDDALRAARAALEMRDTLVDLNEELAQRWGVRLDVRTGVNTGEVVIGRAPGGEMSTVGDAVNVAQRLEASAPPGQVLVGEEAARLLGVAARLDPVKPLELKGKAAPVPAWRLVSVVSEFVAVPDRAETPFVNREVELNRLRRTFDAVATEGTPRLVTVLGAPGIGKSSLVSAFLADVRGDATAVVGRCLPYGDGITYWPVAEIVRELAGAGTESAIAALAAAGAAEDEAELIAARLARVAGFVAGTVSVEEAHWAIRKLLESLALRGPLVVVFEDIHWAEPTCLDLLEHLATLMAEVPVLLICLARPDLLDERPSWAAVGGQRATMVPLEPLLPGEAGELLEQLISSADMTSEEGATLLVAAEGNPFFLQQMVAVRAEARDDATAVPPTIQAVLTARIDRLPPGERAVIERGSIEGRTFHRGSLAELLPEAAQEDLDANLAELVRRQLIRPGRPDFENEEAYRFDHILIRDATYSLLPKHLRADLHERHARWLERRTDPGEHAELAGYHFEQAFRCRVDVEPAAREIYQSLATSGGRHLETAGRRALARDDLPAAISLLERATVLLSEDDAALDEIMPELGMALRDAGRLSEAERVLDDAVSQAAARDDARAEAHAEVARLFVRLQVDTDAGAREVRERFDSLRAVFERTDDDLGLGRLWRLRALVFWTEARSTNADAAWECAAKHAQRAGDERGWSDALSWLASSAYIGPAQVEIGIARCETIRAQLSGHRRSQALVLHPLAGLRAMRGEFAVARSLLADSNAILTELGVTMHTAVSHHEAFVALISGDAAGAEAVLRTGYERLAGMGEKALLATTAAILAHVIYEQGRPEDAWEFTQVAEDAAAADDLSAQILWRTVRARLLARRGEMADAERMSAEAVGLAGRTDWLTDHADALLSQAKVFRMAGETKAATEALENAIALYRRKGNTVGARRARSSLDFQVPVWDI
jgi:class 3 adenylate cyclase/tetratricopeptide (TPR) repeat protein